jgi:FkbM family methyltransferase
MRDFAGATLGQLPVRVRAGAARGARWTLFPWTSYWKGTHEPAMQAAVESLGDISGWACWDLGAHFGLYSVALALRTGPTGEVAAFEPNPGSFGRLQRHARMNGLSWLKAHECAVSDEVGRSQLLNNGDKGTTSAHLLYDGEDAAAAGKGLGIRTVRLDDEVEAGRLRAPQFIKVDVEGHGHRALRGMARTLSRARPQLIVALHSDAEARGVLAVLDPLGYSREAVGAPPDSTSLIGADYWFRPLG